MMQLRDYQEQARQALRTARRAGHKSLLLVAPTGSGKTVMAAGIIEGAVKLNNPVIFLAHRTELIDQTCKRLTAFGIEHGVIKAAPSTNPGAGVQVASVQTLTRRPEMPPAGLIIVDESHRVLAESYRRILNARPDAILIGLTATPIRLDGRGLGDMFTHLTEAARVEDLISQGVLLAPRVFAPSQPDLDGVKTEKGDYHQAQLAAAMDKPQLVGDIVEHWQRLAEGRRTVVFAASVDHSRSIRNAFFIAGIPAEHVDGTTPATERAAILARLESGETLVVCNYGVLVEGWDCPACAVCVLARPTKSLGQYLQMVGRVMRTDPGKAGALVIDHAGATLTHGFATQDREWTLDTTKPKPKAIAVRTCLQCYAVAGSSAPECPECGAEWPVVKPSKASVLRTVAGELKELTPDQLTLRKAEKPKGIGEWHKEFPGVRKGSLEYKTALFVALDRYGAERAYKPHWPHWMFRQVTKHQPGGPIVQAAIQDRETRQAQ